MNFHHFLNIHQVDIKLLTSFWMLTDALLAETLTQFYSKMFVFEQSDEIFLRKIFKGFQLILVVEGFFVWKFWRIVATSVVRRNETQRRTGKRTQASGFQNDCQISDFTTLLKVDFFKARFIPVENPSSKILVRGFMTLKKVLMAYILLCFTAFFIKKFLLNLYLPPHFNPPSPPLCACVEVFHGSSDKTTNQGGIPNVPFYTKIRQNLIEPLSMKQQRQ